ncbi:hypothetical protein EST62_09965 [Chlorobaculum sp. 24CR]|uniref:hypothetical protein n=1 Tax=Chlorobaculum sp. 24CR TaxID=2508878 RepID=UPI00100B4149|nr:hypothetical protein [Chlorobaculum sp. 24CR]RXK84118.1 hypothetical protein EST62_09965 [Chlorobaculum sp. 24CR]
MENQPANTESAPQRRHYIVVVHGMGEQKCNVTAPAIVQRFAEARQRTTGTHLANEKGDKEKKKSEPPNYNFIIPANLSEQTIRNNGYGHGWAEFEGIPVTPPAKKPEFNGTIATDSNGTNFRFVDLDWQFILRSDIDKFGSSTEEWSKALLDRLELRKERKQQEGSTKKIASWAIPMLNSVVNTALPLKQILAFISPDLAKHVFDGFLGDVHLYGDYGRTRGRAVRHFHAVLDEIMIRDFLQWYWNVYTQNPEQNGKPAKYEPPEFTIIAHSLGTIMSFDALVYAHIKDEIRKNNYTNQKWPASLPFPGYDFIHSIEKNNWDYLHQKLHVIWNREQYNNEILKNIWGLISPSDAELKSHFDLARALEENNMPVPKIPYLSWKNHIKSYITLGSPIDKFYVLWPEKYTHLEEIGQDQEEWLKAPAEINHYNFCDEQDPVGHHLEEVMGTRVYKQLFKITPTGNHDVVFRRYEVPGYAHIKYFDDRELFFGIVDNIIDTKNADDNDRFVWKNIHDKKGAESSAKRWAYYFIPFFTVLATTALLSYGLMNESLLWKCIYIIVSVLLWVQPNALTAYKEEIGKIRNPDELRFALPAWLVWILDKWNWPAWALRVLKKWDIIRPVRGIFSRLVSAAIEWRRILIVESLGSNTITKKSQPHTLNERISFQSQEMKNEPLKYFTQLIIISSLYLVASLILFQYVEADTLFKNILFDHQDKTSFGLKTVRIAFFFTLTYTFVRFYVVVSFFRAWWRIHPQEQKNRQRKRILQEPA